MTLLSVEQARVRILSQFQLVSSEIISLVQSANRILAMDIIAADDLPLFDNSSMDGFAIRAADSSNVAPASRVTLRVIGYPSWSTKLSGWIQLGYQRSRVKSRERRVQRLMNPQLGWRIHPWMSCQKEGDHPPRYIHCQNTIG